MLSLQPIPRTAQPDEPWANGAGVTTVVLREPDTADWQIRISVAMVESAGPFSELPGTRRILVPLDAPMTLKFPNGKTLHTARFGRLNFDGTPAPVGELPEGPTRDFNLMLRGNARGEVLPRTLVDSMLLSIEPGVRWLVWLASGQLTLQPGTEPALELNPGDAVLVSAGSDAARALVRGSGEVMLVKLSG